MNSTCSGKSAMISESSFISNVTLFPPGQESSCNYYFIPEAEQVVNVLPRFYAATCRHLNFETLF